jgi:hypothetical protein
VEGAAVKRIAILSLLIAAPKPAYACDDLAAPVELTVRTIGLGAPRSACTERQLSVSLGGAATIDVPNFYGLLGGGLTIGARWPVHHIELRADLRAAEETFAQNASLKATSLDAGPFTVGALRTFHILGAVVAPAARLVLPLTDSASPHFAGAGELALHADRRVARSFSADAHVAVLGALYTPPGATDRFGALVAGTGAAWLPARRWAIHLGVEASTGWYGAALDHLLVRGGVRFRTHHAGDFTAGALIPLAGRERTDLAFVIDWRFPL